MTISVGIQVEKAEAVWPCKNLATFGIEIFKIQQCPKIESRNKPP